MIHQVEHQFFENHAQAASPDLTMECLAGDGANRFRAEAQPHIFILEHALILLHNRVPRLDEYLHQRSLVQFIQNSNDWQTADKFRNQTEFDQVLGLGLAQKLGIPQGRN